ncbi:adhesive plaque matrix protein-like [Uloborus diversus]|uniref:adhesive plaque matrix protein-like n=1 Tax=Uloborus diversus TaxID=327109 RepID=UPI00240969C8|nr:adhesive plaque matrix protein-like [Uloborus diversus]
MVSPKKASGVELFCPWGSGGIESEQSEVGNNDGIQRDDTTLESRSDYPDFDDLSDFFDFEIGPSPGYRPSGSSAKKRYPPKDYYYYKSKAPGSYGSHYYHPSAKKQVVTPGTHYKPPTEKPHNEEERKNISEGDPVVIGGYQVSVVDADSPVLSKLGLSREELERLSGYTRRSTTNATMVGSDSVPPVTYAETPRQDYNHPGPSSYDSHKHSNYPDPPYNSNGYYPAENPHRSYNPSSSAHPPPQGSYDAKSYRAVQQYGQQNSGPNHHHHPTHSHPYEAPYTSQRQSTGSSSYQGGSSSYQASPGSSSYNPHRSYSSEPWKQIAPPAHTDWDDKSKKQENWNDNGHYPPHPPPLPYSSTSSNSGSHYPKSTYSSSSYGYADKPRPYSKPDSVKPHYSSSSSPSSSSSEYHSHKPSYRPSSSYSSGSKAPERAGSVSYGSSSSHYHHEAPSKPGITIRFKAKAPGHGHGVSVPLSFNPLEVLKKLSPLSALNPLNNKKVTIGITIENKKEHDYHSYKK